VDGVGRTKELLVPREFSQVAVIGLGTMGAGIVEVFARNGLSVLAIEKDEPSRRRGQEHVETSTARAVARGKLDAQARDELLGRIEFGTDLKALSDVDLVVEAVPESLDIKRAI